MSAWTDFILGVYVLVAVIGFPVALLATGIAFGWLVARNKVMRQEVESLVDRMLANETAKQKGDG